MRTFALGSDLAVSRREAKSKISDHGGGDLSLVVGDKVAERGSMIKEQASIRD